MPTPTETRVSPTPVCDLRRLPLIEAPFPHVVHDAFVAPEIFSAARDAFPVCPPSTGPTGFSLYWEDADYQALLASSPAWRALSEVFHSQAFIDWAVDQFAPVWAAEGCRIDLSRATYVDYHESRADKERNAIAHVVHAPHELFVRLDIHQGRVGYARAVHRDHARRLISMLVYMVDQDAIEMAGGELILHPSPLQRLWKPTVTVSPKQNLMVAFPCGNRSHHSVAPITATARPRNYIQVQISSSIDAWPRSRF